MSKCSKTQGWDEPYFRKYLETALNLKLEELLFLKECYFIYGEFSRELVIVEYAISLKKTSLGSALC